MFALLNEVNPDVAPAWHAVKLDESRHCNEKFLAKCGGRIYGVYIVDFNSCTYCCEITPSYALYLFGFVPEEWPEDADERDALSCELLDAELQDCGVSYYHCSSIAALSDACKHAIELNEDEWQGESDRGEEAAREAMQASPVWA